MAHFLVLTGTSIAVPISTFDDPKVADVYRESCDGWYGEDHPLTPTRVETIGNKSVVLGSGRRDAGLHGIFENEEEAEALRNKINARMPSYDPRRARIVEVSHHNMRPFPVAALKRMEAENGNS